MRALLVQPGPQFSVQDVYNGWHEALNELLGEENVETFDTDKHMVFYASIRKSNDGEIEHSFKQEEAAMMTAKHLNAVIYEWWPEVIFIVSGFYTPPYVYQLARQHGMKVVLIHTESPYEDDIQLARAAEANFNVINDPTNIDRFTAIGHAMYLPHAYRPGLHKPGPVVDDMKSDFCFIGTGYASRIAFMEQVDWSGIDVALGGTWQQLEDDSPLRAFLGHDKAECMFNEDTVLAYRSTQCSANLYRVEALREELSDGWAMGPREVELAATGTYFGRQSRPEGDEVFPMLPVFHDPKELEDIVRWALRNPEARQRAATQARAAIADRTFTNHARQLLAALGI